MDPSQFWIRFFLAALVTWRVSHLLASEDGPGAIVTRLRARLWRAAIPRRAPVAGDVDLAFLAREFALTGGDIRVAALDAAFAAAADKEAIDMARLCKAVSRQLLKKGKARSPSDFRHIRRCSRRPRQGWWRNDR